MIISDYSQPNMPKITLISALNKQRTIGVNGTIPWHLPNDFKHFKKTTLNHTVVMGRKTFASLPDQTPLPNRKNVILSTTLFEAPGFVCCKSIKDVLKLTEQEDEIFIIGGENIYKAFLPLANELILTFVDQDLVGDVFFPFFEPTQWRRLQVIDGEIDAKHKYKYSIQTFRRI